MPASPSLAGEEGTGLLIVTSYQGTEKLPRYDGTKRASTFAEVTQQFSFWRPDKIGDSGRDGFLIQDRDGDAVPPSELAAEVL
jgi:hypothetical protein